MITIVSLFAGRFYSLAAYSWGLSIINWPKEEINLLFLTNSEDPDFLNCLKKRTDALEGYNSVKLIQAQDIPPSSNAFVENGVHTTEHAETIAKLYNLAYEKLETELILLLEDDVIAPSNAVSGLWPHILCPDVGYACGTQMNRHRKIDDSVFIWDLVKKRVYPEGDSCDTVTYAAKDVARPWGTREIGLGHFGLTMLKRSVCERLPKPVFKAHKAEAGALVGADMVMCIELEKLGLKRIANLDVRGLHMDSRGRIH